MKHIQSPDLKVIRLAALFTLLFVFAAHAFCFFNLTLSGSSVMIDASSGSHAQTAGGQYLQPYYWRLRGTVSVPFLVGLISAACLCAANALCALLLRLRRALPLAALCGVLTVNAAVTSVFAASLHTADAVFLSLAFCAGGALLCLRTRLGFLLSSGLFAAAAALHSSALPFAVSLMLIALACDLTGHDAGRVLLTRAGRALVSLLLGAAVYAAGYIVMLRRAGADPAAALQLSTSLAEAWLVPVRVLFAPLTAYAHLNAALRVLLLAAALVSLVLLIRRLPPLRSALLALIVLALPLTVNLPVFAREGVGQTSPAFFLLDVMLIVFLDRLPDGHALSGVRRACAGALAVLMLGCAIFSNQVYLKKNLEFEATLSVMTRLLSRIERVEGFTPGSTPVAFIGSLDESVYGVTLQGFEHLTALEAASGSYAVSDYKNMIWYCWQVLGYPFNFVSTYEHSLLEQNSDVIALPAYPDAGSIRMIDGVLVIKLS